MLAASEVCPRVVGSSPLCRQAIGCRRLASRVGLVPKRLHRRHTTPYLLLCKSGRSREEYEVTLQKLQAADDSNLRCIVEQSSNALDIDFLVWLAEVQDAADPDSRESEELETLISQILCISEGLDPISKSDALEYMRLEDNLPDDTTAVTSSSSDTESKKVMQHARLALTPEGSNIMNAKAEALWEGMRAAKEDAATSLIGRRSFPTLEDARNAEQRVASTNVAARILAVLISISSRAERRAALVDALTPPSSVDEADDDLLEEELLFTSPFTLLTTVDMELARLKSSRIGDTMRISGQAPADMDVEACLLDIRSGILEYLEQGGAKIP